MRAVRVPVVALALVVVLLATPAFAHTGFTPEQAAPGSVITLELSVQNERPDSGTTQVELVFPEGAALVVADLPLTEGWTAAVVDGAIGGPASGITWTRPAGPAGENPVLTVRLGPLPVQEGRLQFKVVQTYANGEVDRWIDDWPAGSAEPERPGPVLDLVAGGPGDPAPTTSDAPDSNASPTTTTIPAVLPPTAVVPADDTDGGVSVLPVVLGVIVVLLTGAGLVFRARQRRAR
ncbi:MAG TPA: DUF1775 domain-containing protein [Acidimicrobiia bacterium]|nr:DUF1775 domain-containing protein [Acidimicrobiia bacterium]